MNLGNGYAKYREQSILTAGPGDLVVMLYDGALKQLRIAIAALADDEGHPKNPEQASQALIRAQDIICELIQGLDFSYEISNELLDLYDYFNHELIQANIKKDCQLIESIYELIAGLRETWAEAVQICRKEQSVAVGG